MSKDEIICYTKIMYTLRITLDTWASLCIYENVEIWINLNDCIHWHIVCLVSLFSVYNEQISHYVLCIQVLCIQYDACIVRSSTHNTQHTTYCIMYTICMLQCVDTLYNHLLILCIQYNKCTIQELMYTVWWIIYTVVLKRNMSVNNYCIHL